MNNPVVERMRAQREREERERVERVAMEQALADAAFNAFDAWQNDRPFDSTLVVVGWTAKVCEECHGSGDGPTEYCGDGCCSWRWPCESCTSGYTNVEKA